MRTRGDFPRRGGKSGEATGRPAPDAANVQCMVLANQPAIGHHGQSAARRDDGKALAVH